MTSQEKIHKMTLCRRKRYRENHRERLKEYYREYRLKNKAKLKSQKLERNGKEIKEKIASPLRMKKRTQW